MTKQVRDYWQQFCGDIFLIGITLQLAMMLLAWDQEPVWRLVSAHIFGGSAVGLGVAGIWYHFWGKTKSLTAAQTTQWLYLLNERGSNPERNWWTWSKGLLIGLCGLIVGMSFVGDQISLPATVDLFLGLDSAAIALGVVGINVLHWLVRSVVRSRQSSNS